MPDRGRLKIFFGASPGVGKTYAMLEAARRAQADGLDLVIGVVDTHGRDDTAALAAGLPRLASDDRVELDLDGVLARKPAIIVIDELAHTNPTGTRHARRWQDVLELLQAGISVWTALDVHHVESLGDVIEQILGVKVADTVPDAVLERADEVELIDLPPEGLLERLAEGKVHVADPVARRAADYFTRGTLLALRELALRRIAERVDVDVLAYRREHGIDATWPTRERIVVCVGPSPGSERLIRAARRMADGLRAPWMAATVDVIAAPPLSTADAERLEAHLRLAERLGGTVVRLRGYRIPDALLDHARAHNVTRIVAGKPTHPRWRDRLRGSLLDELIRGSGPIEVHVIAPLDPGAPPEPVPTAAPERRTAWPYVWSAIGIAAVTALGLAMVPLLTLADLTMLYLIAIMLASFAGRGPSLVASTLAVLALDVCFVPPRFTFTVTDTRHLLTFSVMFASGFVISTLTVRLRREQRDAVQRERRTAALLAFTREVATAGDETEVAVVAARHLEDGLDAAAAVMVPDADGHLVAAAGLMALAGTEQAVVTWAFEHRAIAGHGTDTMGGARVLAIPFADDAAAYGVIALQRRKGAPIFDADQIRLLDALARQTTLALGRVRLAEQARQAAVRATTEELRSSLLSAVSHDLRTPLAVITGAATTLRDDDARLTPAARAELLATIVEDAQRLERMLANLLQLTRVETGLEPAREWVPGDEVVGAALTRLEDALRGRAVEVDVPDDLLLWIDPVLFEQVLINLIENALKHAAPPLSITVRRDRDRVVLEVGDRGPGLPGGPTAQLFEKFVRASTTPGVGLGLAVVRAIVMAHGGTVTADNRPDGGAVFRVEIPAGSPPAAIADRPAAEVA